VLADKAEAKELIEVVGDQQRRTTQYLQLARELKTQWEKVVADAQEEAEKARREAIRPRKINFDSTTKHRPLATPKDNMKKAA
jgi:hypothetical protein